MAYDGRTNREAVKAYSHPGVAEYIPRSKQKRQEKASALAKVKRFFGLK